MPPVDHLAHLKQNWLVIVLAAVIGGGGAGGVNSLTTVRHNPMTGTQGQELKDEIAELNDTLSAYRDNFVALRERVTVVENEADRQFPKLDRIFEVVTAIKARLPEKFPPEETDQRLDALEATQRHMLEMLGRLRGNGADKQRSIQPWGYR